MKRFIRLVLTFLVVIIYSNQALGGTWTNKQFLYKPPVGARGETEKNSFDSGLDRVDARLGKEVWVGDPAYGTTLQNAVTAIGSNNAILRVPAGVQSIATDFAIPANITLKPERGAVLEIATTKTLTINGGLEAGFYQIFSYIGTGKVVYNSPEAIKSSWWGSGAASVQNAHDAVNNGSRTILLPGGRVDFSTTSVNVTKEVTLLGQGGHIESQVWAATSGTIIRYTGTGYALYLTTNAGSSGCALLQDFSIDCNNAGVGGIKVGNSGGSPKGFNGTIRNVTLVKATGDGIWVNYAVDARFENVRSSYNAGVGWRIYMALNCKFEQPWARYNGQEGIRIDTLDSGGNVISCSFNSFDVEANGYEGINVQPYAAGSIDRVYFRDGWFESNQANAGRTTGYYQFLAAANFHAGQTYQAEMGLINCSFRDVTSPWNGTTGNRQLSIGSGRWTIQGISDYSSNTANYPSFVTSSVARLVMSVNEGVLAKWTLSPYTGIEGVVAPVYSVTPLSSSGTGETTLQQYSIPKNTIGRMTYISSGVFKPAYGYGNGGIHIKAAGTKTGAAGNKTIKLYFGSTVVATIGPANNTNNWEIEAEVLNNSAAGAQTILVKIYDGSTLTVSRVTATESIAADILVKATGQCVDGGDSITHNYFIFQRF